MKKRWLALLLAMVMIVSLLPSALAADGGTTPPGKESVAGNTPTPLPTWEGVTENGHVLSGWMAPDGMVYDAGKTVEFSENTDLTALYGHAEIEKDLGEADTATKGNTMRNDYQLTAAGAADPTTIGTALDFSAITVNGAAVRGNVTRIEFVSVAELPQYDIIPATGDAWRAVITDSNPVYNDVLYAREVGEGKANQVLACLRSNGSGTYNIMVYGVGGVSAPADSMGLFYNNAGRWDKLTAIDFSQFDTSNVETMQNFLMGCSALTAVDFSSFDTSKVWNMQGLLYGCSSLTTVDASPLEMENVQNMSQMFYGCTNLTSVNTAGWNTGSAINMNYMFQNCTNLPEVDASAWDTKNVQYMAQMFYNCPSLQKVRADGWKTGNVTTMRHMFRKDLQLASVTGIEDWDVSKVSTFECMFYMDKDENTAFTGPLDLSGWNPESVENMNYMFSGLAGLTELKASGWEMPALTSADSFVFACDQLTSIDLSDWDVPRLESVSMMFSNCFVLEAVDLSTWKNVNSIDYMYAMFSNAKAAREIKIPNWTVVAKGEPVSLYSAFSQCDSLEILDMSGWTVGGTVEGSGEVWSSMGVFSNLGIHSTLKVLDISDWTIAEGTPSNFFQGNSNSPQGKLWSDATGTPLKWENVEIRASHWNLNNVELDLSNLFSGTGIQELNDWYNISGITSMRGMFQNCPHLRTAVFYSDEMTKLTDVSYMFHNCTNLYSASMLIDGMTCGVDNFNVTAMFDGTTNVMNNVDTYDNDYGNKINDAFQSRNQSTRSTTAVTRMQAAVPAISVVSSEMRARTASSVEETVLQLVPQAVPLAEDSGVASNEPGREDRYQVTPDQTVTYKLTVKYVGDEGAKSGVITVTDALPNGVIPVDGSVKISDVRYSDGSTSGYKGGAVTSASFNGTTFTAEITGLYAGTEVDISFVCTLSAVPPVAEADGNYQYWDNIASVTQTEGPLTNQSNTLRLWYKDESPVIPPVTYYYIDAGAGENGSISPSGQVAVPAGGSRTFTITADESYVVADVLVDGVSVGPVGSYTFSNVRANHTISVIFRDADGVADPDDTGVSDWLDTNNHNAYLQGYGNDLFAPDAGMTRAEVAQMFYNLLRNQNVTVTVSFEDVPDGKWYTDAVNTLASLGIIQGAGDGKFYPNSPITRAEFVAIAMRFTKGDVAGDVNFTDVSPSSWYYKSVVGAVNYGWIVGYGNGLFAPRASISRAEVTTIVNRMLGRSADRVYVDGHLDELKQFSDVTRGWAFYQIIEATNSHTHTITNGQETWTGLS